MHSSSCAEDRTPGLTLGKCFPTELCLYPFLAESTQLVLKKKGMWGSKGIQQQSMASWWRCTWIKSPFRSIKKTEDSVLDVHVM